MPPSGIATRPWAWSPRRPGVVVLASASRRALAVPIIAGFHPVEGAPSTDIAGRCPGGRFAGCSSCASTGAAARVSSPRPSCSRSRPSSRAAMRRRFRASAPSAPARPWSPSAGSTTARSASGSRSREPDALIIQDPTLLHQVDVFGGLSDDGFILINSSRSLEELGLGELYGTVPVRAAAHRAGDRARARVPRPAASRTRSCWAASRRSRA